MCVCVSGVCEEQVEPQVKRLKEVEAFVLSEQQKDLIQEDEPNRKLWDEALSCLVEGPVHTHTHTLLDLRSYRGYHHTSLPVVMQNFLRKVEQMFMCVCCQELSYQPITTECSHNVCKVNTPTDTCQSKPFMLISEQFQMKVFVNVSLCDFRRAVLRSVSNVRLFVLSHVSRLAPDLSAEVVSSRGVHLPRLPSRPGQRLQHDPQQNLTAAPGSVFPRLQQRTMS